MPPHSLDVQYQGKEGGPPKSLSLIVSNVQRLIDPAAKAYAEDGGEFMLGAVKEATPESKPPVVPDYPYTPGGNGIHLKDEIKRTGVSHEEGNTYVYETKVGSDKPYAPYVDEGTGLYGPNHARYLIAPHDPSGMLAWPGQDGRMHYAKFVWHPGSPGAHFMMKGLYATESGFGAWRIGGDAILAEANRP